MNKGISPIKEEELLELIPKELKEKFDALRLRLYDDASIDEAERERFILQLQDKSWHGPYHFDKKNPFLIISRSNTGQRYGYFLSIKKDMKSLEFGQYKEGRITIGYRNTISVD